MNEIVSGFETDEEVALIENTVVVIVEVEAEAESITNAERETDVDTAAEVDHVPEQNNHHEEKMTKKNQTWKTGTIVENLPN